MKIQIVYLDPHDDYGSIGDKLLWTKAQRALLVWPGRGEVLKRRLDLVLLKRLGQQQGIAIGLLTHDPSVQALARELSIPLFEDLEHLPDSKWSIWQSDSGATFEARPQREFTLPIPKPTRAAAPYPAALRILLLLLPMIFILLALILLIPSAEIQLYPSTLREIQTLTFSLAEQSDASKLQLSYSLQALDIHGERRIPTSERMSVPDQFASGEVVFTNLIDQPLSIPAGTSIRSSDPNTPYFRTDRTVLVEGGEGTQVLARVTAATAGPDGNLAAETIDRIDGTLGLSLTVSNPEAMSGGSLQTRSSVGSRDKQRLREELEQALLTEILSQTAALLPSNQMLLESSIMNIDVIDAVYDAETGAAADSLSLALSLHAEVAVIDLGDVQRLSYLHLEPDLPTGYVFAPGSPEILEIRDKPAQNQDLTSIEVDLALRSTRDPGLEALRANLRGASLEQARKLLDGIYTGSESPEIIISPSWFPRLPFLENQIQLHLVWGNTP
ncbi:MAG: hypothetical protein E4G99_05300 [Anaerolineales bacterium]|nr:MAG: hypothetical protein E4G99_05300 [Anaerolineales bacterium]